MPGSRGGLHPEGGLLPSGGSFSWGVNVPGGVESGLGGLLWGVCSGGGGVGIPACADGMHTTGMHSCSINLQDNFTSRQRSCGKVNFQSCLFVIHSIERGGRSFHIWGSSPSSEPWTCSNLLNLEYSVHGSQDMSRHCQVET